MLKIVLPKAFNYLWVQKTIGISSYFILQRLGYNIFSDLLIKRRNEMWRTQLVGYHSVQECEHEKVEWGRSFNDWHCCPNWQRKLSNKINAKFFAESCGVKVAKLIWHGEDASKIPFDTLPSNYVIKSSNGWCSEQVMPISHGKNIFTNNNISKEEIIDFFLNIKKQKNFKRTTVFVEEFISPLEDNPLPIDYKLWCFHEKVEFIQVMDEINSTHTWYSRNWEPLEDQMHFEFCRGKVTLPPTELSQLIETAERLSRAYDYKFVRIDLYISGGEVFFGEFTHTPYVNKTQKLFTPFASVTLANKWINM